MEIRKHNYYELWNFQIWEKFQRKLSENSWKDLKTTNRKRKTTTSSCICVSFLSSSVVGSLEAHRFISNTTSNNGRIDFKFLGKRHQIYPNRFEMWDCGNFNFFVSKTWKTNGGGGIGYWTKSTSSTLPHAHDSFPLSKLTGNERFRKS